MKDILAELAAITRETGAEQTPAGDGQRILLRRTYDAPIEDVWDALTSADRLARWFLPISGDLRLGGRYQFDGNAGGEILACEAPRLLRASWEMGPGFSEVEVRLTTVDDGTLFQLTHIATVPPQMWDEYGPGAVGVGWDLALLGLALHLQSEPSPILDDKQGWASSDEARACMVASADAWGAASLAVGEEPVVVAAKVAATTAFYAPPKPE